MYDFLEAVMNVTELMKRSDSPTKDIASHYTCYKGLFRHFLTENVPFSMDAALDWLAEKKESVSYSTYALYRNALFRLEHYILFGNINSPFCRSEEDFFCRSGMSESFFRLLRELEVYYRSEQNPCYYHTYSVATKRFFKMATQMGITEPEAISIEALLCYWDYLHSDNVTESRRNNAILAIQTLMRFLHKRGDVPQCYQFVMFNGNADKLKTFKLTKHGTTFHPSVNLESKADEYLGALDELRYMDSSMDLYRSDFYWYFMFLELNHLDHSKQSMESWEKVLPDYPKQKNPSCSMKARRIRTIRSFDGFLKDCSISLRTTNHSSIYDNLPEWSRTILDSFIENRRKDGMVDNTLAMCRYAGGKFFLYLENLGINSPGKITPEIIKAFHNQDYHSTPESLNAYSIKLRQLLQFMADMNLVEQTLCYAVSTAAAPHSSIVNVLSDDAVSNIYDFRSKASSPLELRDTAIVMLGLRMGIRASDILHLKVNDFDWKNRTLSFVQKKTRKAITLPVPTDVGNSVYKYISHGRPSSAEDGNGYIFIRHQAPYIPLSVGSSACTHSLKRILGAYGIKLDHGQGFHSTRKTFATRLLRAENSIDDISIALGHARKETAEVYLERDEKNMRLCPLPFGGVL